MDSRGPTAPGGPPGFGGSLTSYGAAPISTPSPVSSITAQKPAEKSGSSFSFTASNTVKPTASNPQPGLDSNQSGYPTSKSFTSSSSFTSAPAVAPAAAPVAATPVAAAPAAPAAAAVVPSATSTTSPVQQQKAEVVSKQANKPASLPPSIPEGPSSETKSQIPKQPKSQSTNTQTKPSPELATTSQVSEKEKDSTAPASETSAESKPISSSQQPSSQQTQPKPQYNANPNNRSSTYNNRRPAGQAPAANSSGEFNFDEMNAKFSKEEIAKELGTEQTSVIPAEARASFYDKKTSFFDNISSTTKERIEGSEEPRRRGDERRLNLETFGQEYVYKNNRGGYRGQGRRGGGYYRGGRGGSNNYRQNNHTGGYNNNGGNFYNNNNNSNTNNSNSNNNGNNGGGGYRSRNNYQNYGQRDQQS